jgi:hypothetical protein
MFCNHVAFPLDVDTGAPSFRAFVIALCLLMISMDGLQYVFRLSPTVRFFVGAEKNSRKNAKAMTTNWSNRMQPIEKSPERMK